MKKIFVLLLISTSIFEKISAQGCSDAGFCSLAYHSSTNAKADKKLKNSLTTDIAFGVGEVDVRIITASVLYRRSFNNQLSWDNKLTASYVSGKLGSLVNVGDFYSTVNYALPANKKTNTNLLAGVKLPFTTANDKIDGQPLPMAYQTSIGTFDLLVGAAWLLNKKIEINGALQIPVINVNKNSFFRDYSSEKKFVSTNNFQRKPDGLLRLGYLLKTQNTKWSFKPNVLAIIHIGEDSYENILGKRENISGSSGLTLNLNLQAEHKLSSSKSLLFSVASPIVVRDVRPDGLTRVLTVSAAYQFGW